MEKGERNQSGGAPAETTTGVGIGVFIDRCGTHAPKHATPDPALESEESDDQLSRMFVNNVVKELLGGLENAGGRDDVKGTRILRGFFNNKRVGGLVDRLLAGDEQLPGNVTRS